MFEESDEEHSFLAASAVAHREFWAPSATSAGLGKFQTMLWKWTESKTLLIQCLSMLYFHDAGHPYVRTSCHCAMPIWHSQVWSSFSWTIRCLAVWPLDLKESPGWTQVVPSWSPGPAEATPRQWAVTSAPALTSWCWQRHMAVRVAWCAAQRWEVHVFRHPPESQDFCPWKYQGSDGFLYFFTCISFSQAWWVKNVVGPALKKKGLHVELLNEECVNLLCRFVCLGWRAVKWYGTYISCELQLGNGRLKFPCPKAHGSRQALPSQRKTITKKNILSWNMAW